MDLSEVGNYLGDDDQPWPAEIVRPLANFPPSLWGDRFSSFSLDTELLERYTEEVQVLNKEVRDMLVAVGGKPEEKMILINTLERLGVSYLFEKEIEELLEPLFANFNDGDFDLFTTALHFRIFRQHGYKISCDVFNKFRGCNGDFVKILCNDVMGMLSLYEATYLKIPGEDFLDEALAFTRTQLESLVPHLNPILAEQVKHALKQPFHRGIPRIEARHYISVYEKDTSRDEKLLRLAKLDFNRLQLLHQEELCRITRWWKEDLQLQVSYARDRAVECFLWSISAFFEPQYSFAREMLARVIALITTVDDTYDAYGTHEELKHFTLAVKRWDMSAIDQLPNYMKALYRVLLKVYEELDEEMAKQGAAYGVNYSKEAFKEMVGGYDIETEWLKEEYVPSFDEYLVNALATSAGLLVTTTFAGMGEVATTEAFEWLQTKPKILTATLVIGRLSDDIMSHEKEQQRGHIATGLDCYMKQHGVSKQEAIEEFYKRIEKAWKDINQEMLNITPTATTISLHLLRRVLNLTRLLDVIYKNDDGFTNPESVKHHIISLFVDSIPF